MKRSIHTSSCLGGISTVGKGEETYSFPIAIWIFPSQRLLLYPHIIPVNRDQKAS